VETASGNLAIERSRLRGFDLETASGTVSVETTMTEGERYRIETASGDVDLRLPAGAGATVRVETASGEIACALPAEMLAEHGHPGHREWAGRIHGGGPEVEISTISGDVHLGTGGAILTERADEPDDTFSSQPLTEITADDAQEAGASFGDTATVLSALERGEITVEEAMEQLDALS
jgi:hypothetical protein